MSTGSGSSALSFPVVARRFVVCPLVTSEDFGSRYFGRRIGFRRDARCPSELFVVRLSPSMWPCECGLAWASRGNRTASNYPRRLLRGSDGNPFLRQRRASHEQADVEEAEDCVTRV